MTLRASELLTQLRTLLTHIHQACDLAEQNESSSEALQHYSRADDLRSDLAATFELLDKQLSGGHDQPVDWTESITTRPPIEHTEELYPAYRLVDCGVSEVELRDLDRLGNGGSLESEDPSADNTNRALWCLVGLRAFAQRTGITAEDPELVMSDFQGNMRHLCDALHIDFATVDRRGAEHYWYEVRGQ
jgi:hypothetical protein